MIATGSRHKFVGSLGHTSEDETGLIYMRARWMDPALGRFISEDPARDGANWFEYCRGNPVNLVDRTGKTAEWQTLTWLLGMLTAAMALGFLYSAPIEPALAVAAMHLSSAACVLFGAVLVGGGPSLGVAFGLYFLGALMTGPGSLYPSMLGLALASAKGGQYTPAWKAVAATVVYGLETIGALAATDYALEQGR